MLLHVSGITMLRRTQFFLMLMMFVFLRWQRQRHSLNAFPRVLTLLRAEETLRNILLLSVQLGDFNV